MKRIDIVKREGGYFHLPDKKVRSIRKGDGYGVDVVFEASQLDVDLGGIPPETLAVFNATAQEFHFFITAKDLKRIEMLMEKSDILTYDLVGHGWDGERPFHKLEEFL